MSLINQMLKDLEARRQHNQTQRNSLLDLHAATTAPSPTAFLRHPVYLAMILALLTLVSLFFIYLNGRKPIIPASLSSITTPQQAPTAVIAPTEENMPAQLQNIHVERENDTTRLQFSLSQPRWYSLENNTENNQLLLLIDNIDLSPVCKSASSPGECAASLFPDNPTDFSANIDALPNEKNQYLFTFNLASDVKLNTFLFDETTGKLSFTLNHVTATPTTGQVIDIKKPTSHGGASEDGEYHRAWDLINTKQLSQGITVLEQLLARNPAFKSARIDLTSLFIRLGRYDDANQLIQEGKRLHLHDDTFVMMQARLLLAQNKPLEAQKLLQSFSPSFKSHLDYYALLAATFEKNQDPHAAITLYERLLSTEPNHAAWWLGLAMAKEAIDEKNSALEAYHQALNYQQLAPHVQGYILNRIHALGD